MNDSCVTLAIRRFLSNPYKDSRFYYDPVRVDEVVNFLVDLGWSLEGKSLIYKDGWSFSMKKDESVIEVETNTPFYQMRLSWEEY